MPNYHRWHHDGGTYFFTADLQDRRQTLLTEHIDRLRTAIQKVKSKRPFSIVAAVVLPEHLHMIWELPARDPDYSTRWRLIKSAFSIGLPTAERRSASVTKKGEKGIWQRRFYEHTLRDPKDLNQHVDYIHFNPVKHGHAKRPAEWPYSSIHRHIREGKRTADWGTANPPHDLDRD